MAQCEVCGNEYDKTFTVQTVDGSTHVFDSIECAANVIAPVCEHCGIRVLGHGVESEGQYFCCANCARQVGADFIRA